MKNLLLMEALEGTPANASSPCLFWMVYNMPVLIVGLTGNYGMGKSTVLRMFRELGAVTLETDEIVDTLLHNDAIVGTIREILGDDVIDANGKLDRAKVAARIFRDKQLREALEGFIHPLVFQKIRDFLDNRGSMGGKNEVVIVEIPLLFEKDYADRFRRTVAVYCSQEAVLKRLEGLGIDREDVLMRSRAQLPADEKVRKSDFAINNDGPLEETADQVAAVYRVFLDDLEAERQGKQ